MGRLEVDATIVVENKNLTDALVIAFPYQYSLHVVRSPPVEVQQTGTAGLSAKPGKPISLDRLACGRTLEHPAADHPVVIPACKSSATPGSNALWPGRPPCSTSVGLPWQGEWVSGSMGYAKSSRSGSEVGYPFGYLAKPRQTVHKFLEFTGIDTPKTRGAEE
jgi:hypothetical protein